MGYNKSMTYTVQYSDESRMTALITAYNEVTEALKGLAVVKDCAVKLNRYYIDHEYFMFNFSVTLKGKKECRYLVSIPKDGKTGWNIRSNKWITNHREPIDTTGLSFGHFIRKTDHDKKKK